MIADDRRTVPSARPVKGPAGNRPAGEMAALTADRRGVAGRRITVDHQVDDGRFEFAHRLSFSP